MRRFGRRHPRATALMVLGLYAALFLAPTLLFGPTDLATPEGLIDLDFLAYALQPQFIFALSLVVIVAALGWWRQTMLITRLDRRGIRIAYGFMIVLGVLYAGMAGAVVFQGEGDDRFRLLAVIVALNILVGLFEEVLFRGVLFHGLRARHSLWFALIVSSVLFGVFHAINVFVGQSLSITVFQIVNATALGLLFCAIMLQANSLWPAIVLHALWNCYAMTGQLVIDTVDLGEVPPPADPGWAGYVFAGVVGSVGIALILLWQRRIARNTPPPIPGI